MRLSLAHFFIFYLTVFLALGFGTWLAFLRSRRRSHLDARRFFICGCCAGRFAERVPYQRPRCPHCGAIGAGKEQEKEK